MLRVFLDLTSPIRVGEGGRLKWVVCNDLEDIISELTIDCDPADPRQIIEPARLPGRVILQPGGRATLHQVVNLKDARDGFFSFHAVLQFRILHGRVYRLMRSEAVELDDLPLPGASGRLTLKGKHILVDNYQGGYGKSIKVEGEQVNYLNSDAGADLEIEADTIILGETPGLARPRDNGKPAKVRVRQAATDDVLEPILNWFFVEIEDPEPAPEATADVPPPAPAPVTDPLVAGFAEQIPSYRVDMHFRDRDCQIFALNEVTFGRWQAEDNDQADALLKTRDPARQMRISARHFSVRRTSGGFQLEDQSSLGTRLDGSWPGTNVPVAIKAGARIELTHNMPGILSLHVLGLSDHAVVLGEPDRDTPLFVLVAPETPAGQRPANWNPDLPWIWHHQGGFWPPEQFS